MKTRRDVLILLGAAAFTPQAVLAQSKQAPVVIGWLNTGSRESQGNFLAAFKEELAALGWKEGAQVVFEERWVNGQRDRLPALIEGLKARKPAVIVAATVTATIAVAKALPNTPIVQANGSSPLAAGLVASLARPGGMVTGVTNIVNEVSEKDLELLLAAVPKLKRIGFLADPNSSIYQQSLAMARRSAAQHSVEARFADAAKPEEIELAISRLAKEGAQALVVLSSNWFSSERQRIVKLALARRWPIIASASEFPEAGALLSYGADSWATYRRAAYYVDKILKGAKPGDLPIEQPTKFELVVNLKTAKALGLTIPQPFLMRVDRVIE